MHLERSPEELDCCSQTGVDQSKSARADGGNRPSGWCFQQWTRGFIRITFLVIKTANSSLSHFDTAPETDFIQKPKPILILDFSSQILPPRSVSRVAAVQKSDLLAARSILM